jgi:hypothetical protein
METENYYKLLEIEPTVRDVNVIVSTAKKRIAEWNAAVNHPTKKMRVKEMVTAFNKIIEDVTKNPQILEDHAAEFIKMQIEEKKEQEKAIKDSASMLVTNGKIYEAALDSLAKKYSQYSKADILEILGARIKQEKKFSYVDDGISELEGSQFKGIVENLKVVNEKNAPDYDLYDFLEIAKTSSIKEITAKRMTKQTENATKMIKDAKVTATGLLCGSVSSVLEDEKKRKQYDKSLEMLVFTDIYNNINLIAQSNKTINPDQYKKLLDTCTKKRIATDKAEYYIFKYCKEKNVIIIEPNDDSFVNQVTCRICAASNSPQATVCKVCAFPLTVTCPKCGKKSSDHKELKCTKCGFSIGDMPNAETMVIQANKSLAGGDLTAASKYLAQAEAYWKTYPGIAELKDKLNKEQSKIDAFIRQINEHKKGKRYVTIVGLLRNSRLDNAIINIHKTEAENAINSAKTVMNKIRTASNPTEKLEICMQALSLCADLEEAKKELVLSPPQSPTNLKVNVAGKTVRLSWNKLPSGFLHYSIVRKINGIPQNHSDGEVIADITDSQYDDINMVPGLSYYFAVYSKCGDIYSKNRVTFGPVVVVEEINASLLNYNIHEKQINFTCKFPPNAKYIDIYRDGSLIKTIAEVSFTDSNLITDRKYTYKFVAVFEDCLGNKYHSKGFELQLMPTAPPKPITSLEFKKEGGNIILTWNTKETNASNIRILYSDFKLNRTAGTLISGRDLEQSGKLFTPTLPTKAILPLNNNVKNYFSIWTLCGGNFMFGSEIEMINIPEVSGLKAYISAGGLYVEWNWPNNSNLAKVSYSNNSFDDAYPVTKNCPKELYEQQQAFVISPVIKKDYFIKIQTQKFENNREILSSGIKIVLKNSDPMTIRYCIKKHLFSKKLYITISNDTNAPLPELALVACHGYPPVRREDGEFIQLIPQGTKPGTAIDLSLNGFRKNYYARLFMTDHSINNISIHTPEKDQLKLF